VTYHAEKTEEENPLESTLLHRLLVNTNRMQAIPTPLVILILAGFAGLAWVLWGSAELLVGFIATTALDWAMLRALPRTGRSFGPDKPSVLALGGLRLLVLALFWLMTAPVWLVTSVFLTISAVVYYSTWVEPFRIGVTTQRYETPAFQADAPPLRLLHISDIHMEQAITPRERHLNRLVAQLKPDIIVFTGDFVNLSNGDDPRAEKAIRQVISQWQAPYGTYCVSGTPLVEPLDRVQDFVRDIEGITLLPNAWARVNVPGGVLNILGLVVTHDMQADRENLARMMQSAPQDGMKLLLMHPPDIAPEANEAGIDLYLCGHTHGGQIRLPIVGAVFSSSHLGNQLIMGRYELGRTTLYTSRGVGLEGLGAPRARFLCPPEIILWEISGSRAAPGGES
jgi:predicted MPP superfamily phosphohydrolase